MQDDRGNGLRPDRVQFVGDSASVTVAMLPPVAVNGLAIAGEYRPQVEDTMANYTIGQEATGIVVCRVEGFMAEIEIEIFVDQMAQAVLEARRCDSKLRFLFDNRRGQVFPAKAVEKLIAALSSERRPTDRTATLVANSLNKMQAKRTMKEGDEVFISENAARIWLSA